MLLQKIADVITRADESRGSKAFIRVCVCVCLCVCIKPGFHYPS